MRHHAAGRLARAVDDDMAGMQELRFGKIVERVGVIADDEGGRLERIGPARIFVKPGGFT
jgi:hypothetical protein